MSQDDRNVVSLTVTDDGGDRDQRVNLSSALRIEIGVLEGENVVLNNPSSDGEGLVLKVWNDQRQNAEEDTVPLTDTQRSALEVSVGDAVRVSQPAGQNNELFSGEYTEEQEENIQYGTASAGSNSSSDSDGDGIDVSSPDTDATYDDVGGLDEELEQVREAIEVPLTNPEVFEDLGIEPPKGVLLYGPPGTGKTLIAKAVCNEVDAAFMQINGPEIMSKYKGESEQKLRDTFKKAREAGDAIIFFDEIDAIAGQREDGDEAENRIVSQLLTLMDGMDSSENVVVIGSTNRADAIDPALRRGGRFDREVEIGVPDVEGRKEVFDVHTSDMPLADDVDINELAEQTHGFVGADIETVAQEAAMETLRDCKTDDGGYQGTENKRVDQEAFEMALSRIEPSAMREFVAETPDKDFSDVGGLDEAKKTLKRNIEWPLKHTELFDETATDPAPGVLMYGESGTGKTLLARALAGESEVNFIRVDSTELIDRYVGESEKAVREVFQRARQAAPSIIFIDNLEGIASKSDTSDVTNRVTTQLNTELDGIRGDTNVTAIGACNDINEIDGQLIGTGAFEETVELSHPSKADRLKILEVQTDGKPLADDVSLVELADNIKNVTGGDLESLIREASMSAIEEQLDESESIESASENADKVEVTMQHIKESADSLELDHTL